METRFELQIEGVLAATEKLVSYHLHNPTAEAHNGNLARLFCTYRSSFGKTRGIQCTREEGPERKGASIYGVEGLEAHTYVSDCN